MIKDFQSQRAFTLIEMLVVISIIIILTSIIVPIYQGSRNQLSLQRAVNKLAQDIRRTEEMAMAAKEITNPNNSNEKFVPAGGYGVYFGPLAELNHYIIFADCNNNQDYDGPANQCGSPANKFREKIEEIELESGIQIDSFSPILPPGKLDITFTPPDPTTRVNGSTSTATIILKVENSTTAIKVLPTGLIFIE